LKMNCISENIPTVSPISVSFIASSFCANVGSIGINIPNPSRSMNTVKKMIQMRLSKFYNPERELKFY